MNIKTVRVNVIIYETKSVPIQYVVKGEPAAGYMTTGQIESTPDSVLIAGRSSAIASITEIKVENEDLDISGLTDDLTYTFDLKNYLPSGITYGDPEFDGSVTVVVHIDEVATETFDINVSNITVDGTYEGYRVYVDSEEYSTVSLTLQGLKSVIQSIVPSAITGTVSLEDIIAKSETGELTEGTYSAEVKWNLPGTVKIKGPVSVYVKVEKEN